MPLTINDGSTTPVAIVLNTVKRAESKIYLQEDNAVLLDAGRTVTTGIYRASGKSTRHRAVISLKAPLTQVVNGVTSVIDSDFVDVTFNFSKLSSEDRRKSLVGLTGNAILHAQMRAALEKMIMSLT